MNQLPTESILVLCKSESVDDQLHALNEIERSGDRDCLDATLGLLTSPDAAVRLCAADALAQIGDVDVRRVGHALLGLLRDETSLVRMSALEGVGTLRFTDGIHAVSESLLHDADATVRATAAETLGDLGDESALSSLYEAMNDEDDTVRAYVARAFGLMRSANLSFTQLDAYLEKECSPRVRATLRGSRYRLGSRRDLDLLLTSMGEENRLDDEAIFNQLRKGDDLVELMNDRRWPFAFFIINILKDIYCTDPPPQLSTDSDSIRAALHLKKLRCPLLAPDIDDLLSVMA